MFFIIILIFIKIRSYSGEAIRPEDDCVVPEGNSEYGSLYTSKIFQ